MALALSSQLAAVSFSSSRPVRSVSSTSQSGFLQGTAVSTGRVVVQAAPVRTALSVSARYRGKGTDLSALGQFKRAENDTGSAEVQVAQLSARVLQLTSHLQQHRKDYATTRGLMKVLATRKRLMLYLQRHDRQKYDELIKKLNIRPLKVMAGRGVVVKLTAEAGVEVVSTNEDTGGTYA
ncbi:hypothetical protein WJX72_001317 [[Myrmecia] bisecta]|uniref:30S ribosomal protein S15 n=1 Tax=[Myrmecia] bisecta TaxID=41462 RepID=A0AAW1R539_9CHLO